MYFFPAYGGTPFLLVCTPTSKCFQQLKNYGKNSSTVDGGGGGYYDVWLAALKFVPNIFGYQCSLANHCVQTKGTSRGRSRCTQTNKAIHLRNKIDAQVTVMPLSTSRKTQINFFCPCIFSANLFVRSNHS